MSIIITSMFNHNQYARTARFYDVRVDLIRTDSQFLRIDNATSSSYFVVCCLPNW